MFYKMARKDSCSHPDLSASIEKQKIRRTVEKMVDKYGVDSLSHLTIEGEKSYYLGNNVDGFIAYVVVKNIVVCMGNPVCKISDYTLLLHEFKLYCNNNKLKICFTSISADFSKIVKNNGFIISKYGEEALFELPEYSTKGSKAQKLRNKLRVAEKSGIQVVEYLPNKKASALFDEKIHELNREWIESKNQKLDFSLGELDFDNPLNRRFFIAIDQNQDVQGIIMISPFNDNEGYFIDVMRRSSNSVPGVMEKLIIETGVSLKDEGVKWLSLGLAPLKGIHLDKKSTLLEKIFNYAFKHGNITYNFEDLYNFKKKFNPSHWVPRYVAHEEGINTLRVGFTLAKARSVENIFKQAIKSIFRASIRWKA